ERNAAHLIVELLELVRILGGNQIRARGQQLPEFHERWPKLFETHAHALGLAQMFDVFGYETIEYEAPELNADGEAVKPVICEHPEDCLWAGHVSEAAAALSGEHVEHLPAKRRRFDPTPRRLSRLVCAAGLRFRKPYQTFYPRAS